mgnify:CR=1 FL=1
MLTIVLVLPIHSKPPKIERLIANPISEVMPILINISTF